MVTNSSNYVLGEIDIRRRPGVSQKVGQMMSYWIIASASKDHILRYSTDIDNIRDSNRRIQEADKYIQ